MRKTSTRLLIASLCLFFPFPLFSLSTSSQATPVAATPVAATRALPHSPFSIFQSCSRVVINEAVTDPQHDWNDTEGHGTTLSRPPFDACPGTGDTTSSDEWIELLNLSHQVFDLAGWQLVMTDTTPATLAFSDPGSTVFRFSHGGSISNFKPGERLVIGNPPGVMNNDVYLQLLDAAGNLVDDVEIGDDFESDGEDGAPFFGEDGNASFRLDEAIARWPDGVDTGGDVADFVQQRATLGRSNGVGPLSAPLPVLNNVGRELACEATVTVQNMGRRFTKAILLTWGLPSACPPNCTGPAQVRCSGLIRPGSTWRFHPTDVYGGIIFSVSPATWPRADDVFADGLCEILDGDVVGECAEYRSFSRAFDERRRWRRRGADPDFGPFAGEPVAVHVRRRCQTAVIDTPTTSSYTPYPEMPRCTPPLISSREETICPAK